MYRGITLFLLLFLVGCHDTSFDNPAPDSGKEPATTTITELHNRFVKDPFVVTGNLIVKGIVTTSDRADNFYRTLCIEADGAALEFMAGIDHLHNDYPLGVQVTLRLRDLTLGKSRGVLQAGYAAEVGSVYPTSYLGSPAAVATHLTRDGEQLTPPTPTVYTIEELTPERCGTLVRIEALRYTPEELADGAWRGYSRFCDLAGHSIYTYVRTYANFADEEVPTSICSLTGILQHDTSGGGRFILKLRDSNDCQLD
ncbi:MAG: hypothetical protein E7148_01170 [Rikenellaceae bacterium]|nr:hypothetical protein [Rikenellaceae bacterium]